MLYTVIFGGLAILLVVAVLLRNMRDKAGRDGSDAPPGTDHSSRTAQGRAARQERKRRRAQSRGDRRKRH